MQDEEVKLLQWLKSQFGLKSGNWTDPQIIFLQKSFCNVCLYRTYPTGSCCTCTFRFLPSLYFSPRSSDVLYGRQWRQHLPIGGTYVPPGLRQHQPLLSLLIWRVTTPRQRPEEMAHQSRPEAELWSQKRSGKGREADVQTRWERAAIASVQQWDSAKCSGNEQKLHHHVFWSEGHGKTLQS